MPKGQKQLQDQSTQRSNQQYDTGREAQLRLLEGSPEFQAYQSRTADMRKTIDNGAFADSKNFLSNRDAVAKRMAQRDGTLNMARTGAGALGAAYVNPKQLADQDNLSRDEFARDSALQAEEDKRNFINQTNMQEQDIIGKRIGVDTTVMGGAFGQSNYNFSQAAQIAASRASVLPSLIGMGLQGASMFFNPAGGLMKGMGGGGARGTAGPA